MRSPRVRLVLVLALLSAGPPVADGARRPAPRVDGDRAALEAATDLYYQQRYQQALAALAALVDRPQLDDELRREALQLRAFSLYLLGSHEQAAATWRALLALAPDFKIHPGLVSPELAAFFLAVRQEATPSVTPAPGTLAEAADQRAATGGGAATSTAAGPVAAPSPRPPASAAPAAPAASCDLLWCLVPFGVGQFANDQPLKGGLLALAQASFLGLNIGLYYQRTGEFERLGYHPDPDAARTKLVLQNTFFALWLAAAVYGVIDALVVGSAAKPGP